MSVELNTRGPSIKIALTALTGVNRLDVASVNDGAAISTTRVVVAHGGVASTARPAGATHVEWVGTVEPLNAVEFDVWTNTAET